MDLNWGRATHEEIHAETTPLLTDFRCCRLGSSAMAILLGGTIAVVGPQIAHVALSEPSNAHRTYELYQDVDVAIVPYGLPIEDAQAIAKSIEAVFNDATDGVVTIDTTVIEPTEKTQQLYSQAASNDCIDDDNVDTYGSFIAASQQLSAQGYDKYLALNTLNSCDPTIAGVAQMNGTYGEVFNVGNAWDAIQYNGDSEAIIEERPNGTRITTYINTPVGTGVHELLHLFNLGHSGSLQLSSEYRGEYQGMRSYTDEPVTKTIDIDENIRHMTYHEYGDISIMGSAPLMMADELNVVEKYMLEWPHRELDKESVVSVTYLNESQVTYSNKTATDALAIATLREPLKNFPYPDNMPPDDRHNGQTFRHVAFAPAIQAGESYDDQLALMVYLIGSENDIVFLGEAAQYGTGDATYSFILGSDTVIAEYDRQAHTIALTKQ